MERKSRVISQTCSVWTEGWICSAAVTGKGAYIDTAAGAIQGNESLNTHENTELYSHSLGFYSQVTQFLTSKKTLGEGIFSSQYINFIPGRKKWVDIKFDTCMVHHKAPPLLTHKLCTWIVGPVLPADFSKVQFVSCSKYKKGSNPTR